MDRHERRSGKLPGKFGELSKRYHFKVNNRELRAEPRDGFAHLGGGVYGGQIGLAA